MTVSMNSSFANEIKKHSVLTKDQEIDLSKKAKLGDLEARQKLIEANYKLVISIAKKYHRKNFNFEDLVQESSIGLIKAVDKFDPNLGYKFSTYAYAWIKQAALQFINESQTDIKVPIHSRILNNKIKKAIKDFETKNNKSPTLKELSKITGENANKIKYTIKANKELSSLDDDEKNTYKNSIVDESFFQQPESYVEHKELLDIIKESLSLLSPKEEKIIRLRFGITEDENDTKKFPMTEEMWNNIIEEKE